MVTKPTVKVQYAIVCDEVRRETSGKHLIIGLYGSDIVVGQLPATLLLTFVIFIEGAEGAESIIDVKVSFDGQQMVTGQVKASSVAPGRGMIIMPALPLADLAKEGIISLETKQSKEKWKTLFEMPLRVKPSVT